MKIQNIKIDNFKGIKTLSLSPEGKNVMISGKNATGKTTLSDAFSWLLAGKDFAGFTDFAVSPEGSRAGTVTSVAFGFINSDGQALSLHKQLKKTKTGSAKTECFIDNMKVKKTEFQKTVNGYFPSFEILSKPSYFPAMHWRDRRSILFAMAGDVTNADILAQDPKQLQGIDDLLNGYDPEMVRKNIVRRLSDARKELEGVSPRIDELERQVQLAKDLNKEDLEKELSSLKNPVADIKAEIAALEAQVKNALGSKQAEIKAELYLLNSRAKALGQEVKNHKARYSILEKEMDDLRAEWHKVNDTQPEIFSICPVCNQAVSGDKEDEVEAFFNTCKSEEFAEINREGKARADQAKEISLRLDVIIKELDEIEKQETASKAELKDFTPPGQARLDELKAKLEKMDSAPEDPSDRIEAATNGLSLIEAASNAKARIDELVKEEQELFTSVDKLEGQLLKLQLYNETRAKLTEERINSLFTLISFKLFKQQVNGEIQECCEITDKTGVPWSSMNTAARVNAGLEIINVLGKDKERSPVWIDNKESVNQLYPLENIQTFQLVVNAEPELKVEVLK